VRRRAPSSGVAALAVLGVLGALAGGCSSGGDDPGAADPRVASGSSSSSASSSSTSSASASSGGASTDVDYTAPPAGRADPGAGLDLAAAESVPRQDPVYPVVGAPVVDALHYDLDLGWEPDDRLLTGTETLVFRAAEDAEEFRLDLGAPLQVAGLTLDGEDASYDHDGDDLVVHAPVREDRRYTLVVRYSGTPKPTPAPTTRSDFSSSGWTVTDDGGAWTMQEPYGAFTWFAVDDQPADKAYYTFTLSTPRSMVGVANGALRSRAVQDDRTVTEWRLDEPASSYLVTVAVGDFERHRDRSSSGVPISYWTPAGDTRMLTRLHAAPTGLDWLEDRLGPYPFSTLGFLVVDSQSGMETQTMITLGDIPYATSVDVLVHEMAHHWYGDEVTPTTWRDVWMNEGMAMYLQGVWQAHRTGRSIDSVMDEWARFEPDLRAQAGPPADYDLRTFGEGNIYYGPALMWNELRHQLGDREFWSMVRAWPRAHDDGNADRAEMTSWISKRTGRDLGDFFDAWLLGKTTPFPD
jgi:aminopeptidase N